MTENSTHDPHGCRPLTPVDRDELNKVLSMIGSDLGTLDDRLTVLENLYGALEESFTKICTALDSLVEKEDANSENT
jgi:hypothetical protein